MNVLFIRIHNAGRSQIAEALFQLSTNLHHGVPSPHRLGREDAE